MMFVRDLPSERQVAAFYQTYSTFKGYAGQADFGEPTSWWRLAFQSSQSLYVETLEQTGGIAGRSVLDLGCSTGRFLELIRWKGGLGEGVEIDAGARSHAQALGFSVAEHAPGAAADGKFDVTCCLQVLEHLAAPGELVDVMARLTKPSGRVVVATPNAGEVAQLGPDWIGFRVDLEHFNYFTPATLTALLRRSGLLVEHFWEHRQPALVRTDLEPGGAPVQSIFARIAELAFRTLSPAPERFVQGSFVLSILARKA